MPNKKIVLVGYSGHGFVVANAALKQGQNLLFYTEKKEFSQNPFELGYLGFEGNKEYLWREDLGYILGIGTNEVRRDTAELILANGGMVKRVIHPRATVSNKTKIGIGVFISGNAIINPLAEIGNFCIVNSSAVVEHECQLGTAVHLAPGAVLAGGVKVGDNTFIGANSVIREGVTIGENVLIGAGTVIIRDIEDNVKIVGNPGRKI